ncbi:hypothetical protein GCM10010465_09500 [Actinomadura fibrosa]
MTAKRKTELSPSQTEELLDILKLRFKQNLNRHAGLEWAEVDKRLQAHPERLWSLHEMERTGGEPDVIGTEEKTGEIIFLIALPKVRPAAAAFVTTGKPWRQERNLSLRTVPSKWLPKWE